MLPDPLVLATHNPGKLAEWRALLASEVHQLTDAPTLGLPAPDETEPTFRCNALLKAFAAARAAGQPALGEDAGIEVHRLAGAPGVQTKRTLAPHGDWCGGVRALLDQLGTAEAACDYVAALAIAWPDGRWVTAHGSVPGHLVPPRGEGPGLAPTFRPLGQDATWAELGAAWRADNDHRAAALEELRAVLSAD